MYRNIYLLFLILFLNLIVGLIGKLKSEKVETFKPDLYTGSQSQCRQFSNRFHDYTSSSRTHQSYKRECLTDKTVNLFSKDGIYDK